MYDNSGTGNTTNEAFQDGTPVYDTNGDKVGTVHEYNAQGDYIVVQKGWLFTRDIYIPRRLVARSDLDGVYLSASKDALDTDQYAQPPTGAGTTGTMATSAGQTTAGFDQTATTGTTGTTTGGFDQTTTGTTTDTNDVRIPLREEELVAGKRQEEIGRVHLHKDVIEEQQTVDVPLQREQVTVERAPVSGDVDQATVQDAFQERDIDVPVMGEEAVVGKRAHVAEEVRLHKDAITDQQQVSDTVRKERVTVEGADDVLGADNQTDYQR